MAAKSKGFETLEMTGRELDWLAGAVGLNIFPDRPALVGLLRRLPSLARLAYAPGAEILKEGEKSTDLYIVFAGQADVERGGKRVAELAKGDFFGEVAFFTGSPRTATIRAREGCEVFRVQAEDFTAVIRRVTGLEDMLRDMAKDRIRKLTGDI